MSSHAESALDPDGTVMLLDDPQRNGKAEACATRFPASGLVGAMETFKNPGSIFSGDAKA